MTTQRILAAEAWGTKGGQPRCTVPSMRVHVPEGGEVLDRFITVFA